MIFDNRPIGVFDSGLGGLSAVCALEKCMPGEKIVYFGDTGRVPYGTRSEETVIKYSKDDLTFLSSKNVKAVLVACGTVSSIALDELARLTTVPVVGVVKPACADAVRLAGGTGKIAVLGTPATAKRGAYTEEIKKIYPEAQVVNRACPMFVPLVENGYIGENPISVKIAEEYIGDLGGFLPDCLILGCTHYPLLRPSIEKACENVLGYIPEIVDAGECAVRELSLTLEKGGLLADKNECGKSEFFVSDETHNFSLVAGRFLGREIFDVTKIDIEK